MNEFALRRCVVFAVLWAAAAGTAAAERELRVSVRIEPDTEKANALQVKLAPKALTLVPIDSESWRYSLPDAYQVVGLVVAAVDGVPKDFDAITVEVRVAYAHDEPIDVTLYAMKVEDLSREAIKLHASAVVGVDLPTVFEHYHRSALLSKKRLARKKAGQPMREGDVKVFYKFLESAREIGYQANVKPTEQVRAVANYLRSVKGQERERGIIEDALVPRTVADLELLLTQVDFIEAEQFRRIWHRIIDPKNGGPTSPDACGRYGPFVEALVTDTDKNLREQWEKDDKYRLVSLATNARTHCVTLAVEGAQRKGALDEANMAALREQFPPLASAPAAAPTKSLVGKAVADHQSFLSRKLRIR